MYRTLISVAQLQAMSAVVIDCSADLAKPGPVKQSATVFNSVKFEC